MESAARAARNSRGPFARNKAVISGCAVALLHRRRDLLVAIALGLGHPLVALAREPLRVGRPRGPLLLEIPLEPACLLFRPLEPAFPVLGALAGRVLAGPDRRELVLEVRPSPLELEQPILEVRPPAFELQILVAQVEQLLVARAHLVPQVEDLLVLRVERLAQIEELAAGDPSTLRSA